MGQDCLSKKEDGGLLYQKVHVITSTQELRNSTCNSVKVTADCLGSEAPLGKAMDMWHCHIVLYERKYDKAFAEKSFFRS